ncbi:glucose-6-phosphate dehydrogenase assembly protein OpcA [Streptomyces lonarensis]|uniref:Glucose-6-phosphate dehydrogenase assembly protein OpcA n=1 Tax=Streptomyces lonarensis TaxID=700599 RepID=A0A7X6D1I8_9ACTN|nr:glucose-6-phosphate dehydrogenase assembly protein OpcA [Streptomyces lonarensis]NJQ06504.1 glucose-6-phosphate dehydrogenase assembly protein OpcA [Streptomyces lonarensis]
MKIDLTDTTSGQINAALMKARRATGSPAVGMVLTLVLVTDEGTHYDALRAASEASKEHPSRILVVVRRPGRSPRDRARARMDAEVRVGGETGAGETVLLRLHGELAAHSYSAVLPLLLPDAPVVVWWPEDAPERPASDPLGALAQRRITDMAAAEDPVACLARREAGYAPGDTDLAWTRITPWRSMLASALDQRHAPVTGAVVEGEEHNPSTELLALWLADRLGVPVRRVLSAGPGITGVRLYTADGEICLDRPDGSLAELAVPGQPERHVALHRRDTPELIAEELRRLDPDEAYASALRFGVARLEHLPAAAAAAADDATGDGDGTVEAAAATEADAGAKPAGRARAGRARSAKAGRAGKGEAADAATGGDAAGSGEATA